MGISSRIEKYLGLEQAIVWPNTIGIAVLTITTIYTFAIQVLYRGKILLFCVGYGYGMMTALAITTGAHRLWTHKTYKAKLPLRIWIMLCYMGSGMYGIVQWVRDHRTHHKFTDTNADPHNAKRGFFFSHCGWLMMKRHPELKEKGKTIDVSDVLADPVVQFSEKYFYPLLLLMHIIIPTAIGYYYLNESLIDSFICMMLTRYGITLHSVWLVNSWAHFSGSRPYNKYIMAVDNRVATYFTLGEAWHNFHHTFPWDYKIGEYGQGWQPGTYLITLYSWLGLAYDLKTAPPEMVQRVLEKNGELAVNEEIPEEEFNKLCKAEKEFNYIKQQGNVKNRQNKHVPVGN